VFVQLWVWVLEIAGRLGPVLQRAFTSFFGLYIDIRVVVKT
jgi:hypothetical protein